MKERIDFMVQYEIEAHPGPRIILGIDEFAAITQWRVTKGSPQERMKVQLLADLHLLSQQAAATGIILISSVQRASAGEMDGDYRANLEDTWLFRVRNKSTSGAILGPTEELPADPTRQLARGECIYSHPGEPDRVVRVFLCDAAKDDLAKLEAARIAWAERPEIDDEDDVVVPLRAAE
jgi:DNA segregation ATPase FtsK/SpoIIIE-like protein